MCFALFIGTDDPLPTEEWSKERLRSYFSELSSEDQAVRDKFKKPCVYYAGSWQGCGCGWFSEEAGSETKEDREDAERTKQSLADLRSTVEALLENHDTVELFLCWEGSQGESPRRRITLTVEDLNAEVLPMEELDFAEIVSRKGPSNKTLNRTLNSAG